MKQFSNILYIDTRENNRIIVRLETSDEKYQVEAKAAELKAQMTLPLIEKVLKDSGLKVSDINEIRVEKGPGSFTGLRVGLSIANALGFGLGVKINCKELGEIEVPEY